MVSEGLKGSTAGYIRGGRQKSANADASDLAYTARITYTGMPGLKASLFYNHQSDFTQVSTDNIEEIRSSWEHQLFITSVTVLK